ncbi:MAG: flavin reductase family protein [Gammaproteobacteria bacterium]
MNEDHKKTALRMIPYGLYVMTGVSPDGSIAASTVNWVTQISFTPPLIVVGVKADSGIHSIVKESGKFVLNILGKGQQDTAYAFFKPTEQQGDTINGQAFHQGITGAAVLDSVPAYVECSLMETVEKGDHSIFVAEVIEAEVLQEPAGRADDVTLTLRELGEKVFYGG